MRAAAARSTRSTLGSTCVFELGGLCHGARPCIPQCVCCRGAVPPAVTPTPGDRSTEALCALRLHNRCWGCGTQGWLSQQGCHLRDLGTLLPTGICPTLKTNQRLSVSVCVAPALTVGKVDGHRALDGAMPARQQTTSEPRLEGLGRLNGGGDSPDPKVFSCNHF